MGKIHFGCQGLRTLCRTNLNFAIRTLNSFAMTSQSPSIHTKTIHTVPTKRVAKARNSQYSSPLPVALASTPADLSVRSIVTFVFHGLYRFFHPRPPQAKTHHGILVPFGQCVWIMRRCDMDDLWRKGFFGKGTLSRSEPTWMSRKIEEQQKGNDDAGSTEMSLEEVTEQRRKQRRAAKKKTNTGVAATSNENNENTTGNGGTSSVDSNHSITTALSTTSNISAHAVPAAKSEPIQSPPVKDIQSPPETIPATADLEHLQLNLQEAFFLAYALGCLKIYDTSERELTIQELWNTFLCVPHTPSSNLIAADNPFVVQYVAYHYYRSRGWVAKSGVKFGVDLILYRKGPVFHHAEFAVIVIPTTDHPADNPSPITPDSRPHSWQWLLGVNRVCSQVKKTVILCYVLVPSDADLRTPACLSSYTVREVMLRRWIPERNRG